MARGLLIVVCSLAADVGIALRPEAAVGETGAAMHIMDTITSMVEAHNNGREAEVGEHVRTIQSWTPDVLDTLYKGLQTLAEKIQQDVLNVISTQFDSINNDIKNQIGKVEDETNTLVGSNGKYDIAFDNDKDWYTCVGPTKSIDPAATELNLLAKVQPAVDLEQQAQTIIDSETGDCVVREKDSVKKFHGAKPGKISMSCDQNVPNECDDAFEELKNQIKKVMEHFEEESTKKANTWKQHTYDCNDDKDDLWLKTQARVQKRTNWWHRHSACSDKKGPRAKSMCNFGYSLQDKCREVQAYYTLIADINGDKGSHSASKLKSQYKTPWVGNCVLTRMLASPATFNAQVVDDCAAEAAAELDKFDDVLDLDEKQAIMDGLTSTDKFTCEEKQIKFYNGREWRLPINIFSQGASLLESPKPLTPQYPYPPNAADTPYPDIVHYEDVQFRPAFEVSEEEDPFTFCSASR